MGHFWSTLYFKSTTKNVWKIASPLLCTQYCIVLYCRAGFPLTVSSWKIASHCQYNEGFPNNNIFLAEKQILGRGLLPHVVILRHDFL